MLKPLLKSPRKDPCMLCSTRKKTGSGTFRRRRFGAGHFGAGTIGRQNFFFSIRFSVAYTLCRFVARFARGRIEDPSFNRFELNGIQGIASFIVFS